MAASLPQSTVIAQTHHSTIQTCTYNDKPAILKTCRNPNDPRTRQRWETEVKALQMAASHDNITTLLSFSPLDLTLTLRLEPGQSLNHYLTPSPDHLCTLSPAAGTALLHQQASALAHLHALHIVHDDIKPENIIWDPRTQRAVLIDFGAAVLSLPSTGTRSFNPSGTPSYVPPEFLQRRAKAPEGDVWALGVVMLFVWGYVKLPDGEWFLPGVWDEGGDVEMRAWLGEVRELREQWRGQRPVLGEMLREDPAERISSAELVRRLTAGEGS